MAILSPQSGQNLKNTDNFHGLKYTKMAILTFQNWLKFTFSPFQNGQNQNANNFQGLNFTKRAILSSQNWSRITFSSFQQVTNDILEYQKWAKRKFK